jgi:hypothetical protein
VALLVPVNLADSFSPPYAGHFLSFSCCMQPFLVYHVWSCMSCISHLSLRYLFVTLSSFCGEYFLKSSCASSISCSKRCGMFWASDVKMWWAALISHSLDKISSRCDITS